MTYLKNLKIKYSKQFSFEFNKLNSLVNLKTLSSDSNKYETKLLNRNNTLNKVVSAFIFKSKLV